MLRRANLIECLDQSILAVGGKCHMEIELDTNGREAQALPVVGDDFPSVLDFHFIPPWREECPKAYKGDDRDGEEHREPMVAHATGVHLMFSSTLEKAECSESPLAEVKR